MNLKITSRLVWLMLAASLAFACNRKSQENEDDNIRHFEAFDPRVKAAEDSAQANLDMYIDYYKRYSNDTLYAFFIKTSFTEADEVEHMWSIPFTLYDEGFSCILSNDPYVVQSYQAGDTVHIDFEDIEDFIIERYDSGTIGNYLQTIMEAEN